MNCPKCLEPLRDPILLRPLVCGCDSLMNDDESERISEARDDAMMGGKYA